MAKVIPKNLEEVKVLFAHLTECVEEIAKLVYEDWQTNPKTSEVYAKELEVPTKTVELLLAIARGQYITEMFFVGPAALKVLKGMSVANQTKALKGKVQHYSPTTKSHREVDFTQLTRTNMLTVYDESSDRFRNLVGQQDYLVNKERDAVKKAEDLLLLRSSTPATPATPSKELPKKELLRQVKKAKLTSKDLATLYSVSELAAAIAMAAATA